MANTDIVSLPVEDHAGAEDRSNTDILEAKHIHSRGSLYDPADEFHSGAGSGPAAVSPNGSSLGDLGRLGDHFYINGLHLVFFSSQSRLFIFISKLLK